jgi:Fe2+ transport system protein FeoA
MGKPREPDRFLSCPLCGFEFTPVDTLCQHGCPLRSACGLVRCPMCDYEFPETPRAAAWLGALVRSLFHRKGHPQDRGRQPSEPQVLTVRELATGEQVEVVHLGDQNPDRSNTLAVFGLAPGSEITLVQRHPSYVLQVGETLLALDSEVAGSIVVQRETGADGSNSSGSERHAVA